LRLLKKNNIVLIYYSISGKSKPDANVDTLYWDFVEPKVLKVILPYFEHCDGKQGPMPLSPVRKQVMKDLVQDEWFVTYVEDLWATNKDMLYDVMITANRLTITCLMHLCACKIGTSIRNCKRDQMAETLLSPLKLQEHLQRSKKIKKNKKFKINFLRKIRKTRLNLTR
jgi:hypothetical protein